MNKDLKTLFSWFGLILLALGVLWLVTEIINELLKPENVVGLYFILFGLACVLVHVVIKLFDQ